MRKLAILAIVATVLAGCVKNNPDPAWLEVNEWTLASNATNVPNEGELTHNFTDAWVFIDNKLIGVFEVPFKIPVLVSGTSEIKLYPTIKDNGISATKKIYPFVDPYIIDAELVENQTLTIDPVTNYKDDITILPWDFEDASTGIVETPLSETQSYLNNDQNLLGPYNGGGCLTVEFDDNNALWQATNETLLENLPKQGAELYLELDYHNTLGLITGVVAIDNGSANSNVNVQVNGQDPNEVEWKKIYIDISTIVSGYPGASGYYLSFDALLPDSLSSARINIDNMKVVHF
ncbi:MAG: hypothetical protein Crog4KO_00600 [Crocinitomicaceae bacterium]